MNSSRAGQGNQSPLSTASNVTSSKKKKDKKKDVQDIYDNQTYLTVKTNPADSEKGFITEAECNAKLLSIEQVFEARIKTLMTVLDNKDKVISELSTKVGKLESNVEQLKDSISFLTNETSELKKGADNLKVEANKTLKNVSSLSSKATDLEDRSRRDNIVIFGIPEGPNEKPEDTENLLIQILKKHNMVTEDHDPEHDPIFHRVHRLGPKKADKHRPIIGKCVYYKDRQKFIENSRRLNGTGIFIAEDFSKPTLNVRKQLVSSAKLAREENTEIVSFRINYKRLVMKYMNNVTKQHYYRGFELEDILNNPRWHLSPKPQDSSRRIRNGYQDY